LTPSSTFQGASSDACAVFSTQSFLPWAGTAFFGGTFLFVCQEGVHPSPSSARRIPHRLGRVPPEDFAFFFPDQEKVPAIVFVQIHSLSVPRSRYLTLALLLMSLRSPFRLHSIRASFFLYGCSADFLLSHTPARPKRTLVPSVPTLRCPSVFCSSALRPSMPPWRFTTPKRVRIFLRLFLD